MSSKHFVNDPAHLVLSSLHSLTLTNPAVALDRDNKIVYLRPTTPDRHPPNPPVALVSGGGAGHEPSFAGLVGRGLLSAAVSGTIFASPSSAQVRAALGPRLDPAPPAVLVVIMNYTGDVLNFGVAVEKARAAGSRVEMVVVGDDVGVGRASGGKVGRRGIAGTVLVIKIAGALAARGRSIDDVASVARLVAQNLVSVGASLDHVHVPGHPAAPDGAGDRNHRDHRSGRLPHGEAELGMGIHNEPGCGRKSADLPVLVSAMLAQLLDQTDCDRAFVNVNSNEVVLLVNNLGGMSPLELGAVTAEVVAQLDASWGIRPVRVLAGSYMTSLNGLGFSVSLLNVVNTDIGGPGMIELLDDAAEATGWAAPIGKTTWEARNTAELKGDVAEESAGVDDDREGSALRGDADEMTNALTRALERVVEAEPDITTFDTVVGDGDCGIGMKRGAEALLKHMSQNPLSGDLVRDLLSLVAVVGKTMDGTSGALYSIFLTSLTHALRSLSLSDSDGDNRTTTVTPTLWAEALQRSLESLGRYTPARPGDRTLMDALHPFADELRKTGRLADAAAAARRGADATKGMKAGLGRTVYVGGDGWQRVPDPGAWGLACFLEGLAGLETKRSELDGVEQKESEGEDEDEDGGDDVGMSVGTEAATDDGWLEV